MVVVGCAEVVHILLVPPVSLSVQVVERGVDSVAAIERVKT